jgi:hypothetical protein
VNVQCSVLAHDEPLAGTAPHVKAWVAIEHPGPWHPQALESDHLMHIRYALNEAKAAGIGIILVRRPMVPAHPGHVIVAHEGSIRGGVMALDDVVQWNWQAIASGVLPDFGEVISTCVVVCVHGKRDQCCAIDGRQLIKALPRHDHVWESSHIGGHRFSPVVLNLADGRLYGRIPATEVERMMADVSYVPYTYLRGRTYDIPPVQATEVFARTSRRLSTVSDISWIEIVSDGSFARSRVDTSAGVLNFELAREPGPSRPESCGKEVLTSLQWTVL